MKAFAIPYTASPVKRSDAIIKFLMLLILLPSAYAEGQNFDVASIKPAPPLDPRKFIDTSCHGGPGTKDPSRWTCSNVLLPNLVIWIFNLKGPQISAVRAVPEERFTIAAKVPEGTTNEQFKQMQLNLLIDRFGLKFHREKKEMQGYELTIAKEGSKFKGSKPKPPKDPDAAPEDPFPSSLKFDKDGFPVLPPGRTLVVMPIGHAIGQWIGVTMEDFAAQLYGLAGHKPIIDATGLKGKYDLSLQWAPDILNPPQAAQSGIPPAPEPSGGPNFFKALQEQLGLKLVPKKISVEILVIDHIEKTPTEN